VIPYIAQNPMSHTLHRRKLLAPNQIPQVVRESKSTRVSQRIPQQPICSDWMTRMDQDPSPAEHPTPDLLRGANSLGIIDTVCLAAGSF